MSSFDLGVELSQPETVSETPPSVVPVSAIEAIEALIPAAPTEPLVTAAAIQGALLGIVVLTAGSAAATAIVALAFFR